MTSKFRIGIDVGGTFTHAVALDAQTQELVGKVKVPTTHRAVNGVGEGIVGSLRELMKSCRILPDQILLVAHSTTQATNSLLEGDVERVAIVSVGSGFRGMLARRSTNLGKIPLSPGRYLETRHHHVDSHDSGYSEKLDAFLVSLKSEGIRVVVVAAPFSIEDGADETEVANYIRKNGFICTPTNEISQLYGLKVRTRTAVINLSILPKMLDVAEHTEQEIRKMGIAAPLMIMRSDGGVMSMEEMRKKPILTLLSGPAAGIAAALRYLKVSDGIFLEVGGTSTDISAIRNGRAMVRSAVIGGNRTFLETLDCRTIGIGGGSIPRVKGTEVVDVGPRSAHIAGVKYAAFESIQSADIDFLQAKRISPKAGDPQDYLIFESEKASDGSAVLPRLSFTPSCAANALDLVPDGDCAKAASGFFEQYQTLLKKLKFPDIRAFAEKIQEHVYLKVAKTVNALVKEYKLDPRFVTLVGGGGGASAVVPFAAQKLGYKFEIAKDNDVISAIGAALGLIRVVVERSCLNPTQEDLYRLRLEAREEVSKQGANPATIEVFIEVDEKKNIIRAEAQGAMEYSDASQKTEVVPLEVLESHAKKMATGEIKKRAQSVGMSAFEISAESKGFWASLTGKRESSVLVFDSRGIARLKLSGAQLYQSRVDKTVSDFMAFVESHTQYGDGGVTFPFVFVLVGDRIVDLSKLNAPANVMHVLELELKDVPSSEPSVIIFSLNSAEE